MERERERENTTANYIHNIASKRKIEALCTVVTWRWEKIEDLYFYLILEKENLLSWDSFLKSSKVALYLSDITTVVSLSKHLWKFTGERNIALNCNCTHRNWQMLSTESQVVLYLDVEAQYPSTACLWKNPWGTLEINLIWITEWFPLLQVIMFSSWVSARDLQCFFSILSVWQVEWSLSCYQQTVSSTVLHTVNIFSYYIVIFTQHSSLVQTLRLYCY